VKARPTGTVPIFVPFVLVVLGFVGACATSAQPQRDAGFHVRHLPPGDRDVFEALLVSGGVTLTDPSCKDAGRGPTDTTVGAYLSGFFIEMNKPTGGNHLVIEHLAESATAWTVAVDLRHAEGEAVWSWGLGFAISKQDGSIDPRSFRCLGAG
jgi:hypothetical protein